MLSFVFAGTFKRREKVMDSYGKNKILLVESDQEIRSRLCVLLENLGCHVIETDNSMDAIKHLLTETPDIIIMDLDLPDNTGLATIFIMRQQSLSRNVPILATSGDGGRGIDLFLNIKKMGTGYIGYITKPISLEDLAEQINSALVKVQKAA